MSERSASPVHPGELVGGKYRVERVLGSGAMGVVVAATHEDLGERRAIKFLVSQAQEPSQLERFMREARAAAKLRSPHVAHVFDVGKHETERGQSIPYLVMEYLDGRDLYAVFHQDGVLPVETAVGFLLQAAEGLSEAHAHGIVHRDLKPANLFIEERKGARTLKVLDFGISKVESKGQGAAELTETAMMIGSPSYMAPEQMRSSRSVDARADLWSLGVTFYQLVSGKLPFTGDDRIELCLKVVQDEPPRPTEVNPALPPAVDAVVMRCLRKLPEQRYQDVAELAADLLTLAPSAANEVLVDRIVRNLGQEPAHRAQSRSGSIPTPPRDAGTAAAWTGSSGAASSTTTAPKRGRGRWLAAGAFGVAVLGAGIHFATRTEVASREVGGAAVKPAPSIVESPRVAPSPPPQLGSTAPEPTLARSGSASAGAPVVGPPGATSLQPATGGQKPKASGAAPPKQTAVEIPAPPPVVTSKPDRHTF